MSPDSVTEIFYGDNVTSSPTETMAASEAMFNETEATTATADFSTTDSWLNTFDIKQLRQNESPVTSSVFEAFIIIEIVMTALELIISILAAIKMPRWRRNYRNQMLMQLSVARFVKRVIFLVQFFEEHGSVTTNIYLSNTLNYFQIYIDFVIVILVYFFIRHMYNSLIIVLVKISHNSLYKVLCYSWLLPLPISAVWTGVILANVMDRWLVYLLICCIFRWPLIFLGTSLYVTILYRVMSDKIRKFARSLTVVTFLLCLIINFYLFSKDVIELWCLKSFVTILVSYISGFLMNFFILCFYIILIILYFKNNIHSSRSLPEYSVANIK